MLLPRDNPKNFIRLCLIFFVLFLDFVSFSAVIPLLPPLFFGAEGILPQTSPEMRYILLGALLATYPLAQIFSGPILGQFSDETSRKRILLVSFMGNCVGYLLVALGIGQGALIWLFAGNLISGLLGGNISTINAIIADLSTPYAKARRYGISNLIFGLAFILGPYLISKLSPQPSPYPFLVCAFCSLFNFILIRFFFDERENPHAYMSWKNHWHLKTFFGLSSSLKQLLIAGFLLFFGWYFFIKFFQVFLFHHFQFSSQEFSELLSYFGACCVATQVLFLLFLHKGASPRTFLLVCLTVLALSLLSLLYITEAKGLWIVVTIFSIAYSLITPCFIAVVSNNAAQTHQGKILGLYQSVQALAKVVAPSLAGVALAMGTDLPLIISSSAILASSVLFFFVKNNEKISVSSNVKESAGEHGNT